MKKDQRIDVRVSRQERERLDRLSAAIDMSISEIMRLGAINIAKRHGFSEKEDVDA